MVFLSAALLKCLHQYVQTHMDPSVWTALVLSMLSVVVSDPKCTVLMQIDALLQPIRMLSL